METLKRWLFNVSPKLYFYCRDQYQFAKQRTSGKLNAIEQDSLEIRTFNQAFDFTTKHIKSYQVKSEVQGLIELIRDLEPKSYIEIGTADGGTHFLIRKLCESIDLSVAIDTDIRNRFLIDRITSTADSHYISGYSSAPNTLKAVNRVFPEKGTVDLLFIDGDHRYDGVKSDFELYQPLVRKGGYIIFHDIVEDWGQRYGRETNKYTGGVPTFFSEIKGDYQHHRFVEDLEQDGFGIGVLIQN